MTDEAGLLDNIEFDLFTQAEVSQILPQSEGVKHCKKVIEQVPCWDVHKCHEEW